MWNGTNICLIKKNKYQVLMEEPNIHKFAWLNVQLKNDDLDVDWAQESDLGITEILLDKPMLNRKEKDNFDLFDDAVASTVCWLESAGLICS